ncbi:MAG: ATP-binding protein [Anaerolineae bacterium]|nr:ATP-binding protein [Anaerolineae bacterium]
MIKRALEAKLIDKLNHDTRAIIVYGARQVGKTTLIQQILSQLPLRILRINADVSLVSDALSSRDLAQLQGLVQGYDVLFLDEAQRVPEIGINLKLMIDHIPGLRIIVTGSSSLDLASKTRESLAGRAWNYTLYPISALELAQTKTPFEMQQDLTSRLVYGSYPSVVTMIGNEQRAEYLENLAAAQLYKDILEMSGIRNADKLRRLLRLLAFQIGQEVSLTEIGTQLEMSKNTVAHYIDLLEQSFVLFRLGGYSRNLRKEVSKFDKIYFWDLGVRNVLINNLNALTLRNDIGALWENYVVAERLKWLRYTQSTGALYYWRSGSGNEIDCVEERDGQLTGFECKWRPPARYTPPAAFMQVYAGAQCQVVSPDNYLAVVAG